MQIHPLAFVVAAGLVSCSGTSSSKSESAPTPKPAPAADVKPAPVAATKPATSPDAKPEAVAEARPAAAPEAKPQFLNDFQVKTLEGESASLSKWKGKVVLVVNTASQCGFTPQYAGLEALHKELEPKGFEVLGFPSNQFGGQEPGDAKEIRAFCTDRFQVTFPLYEKVNVKHGDDQAPLYAWLEASTGHAPSWNFCKYLVGKDGRPIRFWSSKTAPDSAELRTEIEAALAAK